MNQDPKKGVSDQINGVRQVIHDLEFHARLFMLVSGYEEVSFCSRDIGSVGMFLLDSVRKLELAIGPKPTTNRDKE